MDKIRIIIISIIIIITFMIIIEFNQFYDKTKRENLIIKYQLNTHNNIKTLNALTDSEIKKLTFNLNTQKYKIRHKIENFNKTYKNNNNCINFINIESDYLAIKIDPKGGHIVYAALKNYNTHIDTPNNPLILLEKNTQRTYIANSGLLNIDDNRYNNPLFFSKYKNYQLSKEKNNIVVDLTYQNKKIFFIKRFIIDSHSYMINIEYIIHNKSNKTWQTAMYGQIKRDNSIDPSQEYNNIGMQPYLGFAVNNKNNRFKKIKFKELKKGDLTDSLNGGWLAMIQHYFLSAYPTQKQKILLIFIILIMDII